MINGLSLTSIQIQSLICYYRPFSPFLFCLIKKKQSTIAIGTRLLSLLQIDAELSKSRITLATVLKIGQYFSCSRRALLNRLTELKLIDKSQAQEYSIHVRASAMNHGYSIKLYEKDSQNEVIRDYGDIARKLFERDRISESHYYGLLEDIGLDFSVLGGNVDEKE